MTTFRMMLSSFVVLVVFAAVAPESHAYDGCAGSLCDTRAFGYSGTLYGLGYLPVPPYFAVHPPVYYGHRTFRSYGESPYARPARSSRPVRIAAQVVINPFVEQTPVEMPQLPAAEEQAEPDQTTAVPQVIINPFYKADEEVLAGK